MTCLRRILVSMLLLAICLEGDAQEVTENWPGWRGPRGDGTSHELHVPTRWDEDSDQNVLWKVALPGEGHASPVVWQQSLFVTACDPETLDRLLLCFDTQTGEIRWQEVVINSPLETTHAL